MTSADSHRVPDGLQEAAEWLTRLNASDLTESDRRTFADWLKRSPLHVGYYLELAGLDVELKDAGIFDGIALDGSAEALDCNVVALDTVAGTKIRSAARTARSGHRWWGLAAAAACLLALASLLWPPSFNGQPNYRSDVGELRSITLDDGSIVTLNTQSEIEVRYSERARVVRLLSGEALFHVAKEASRPFSVQVDDARVQALGTAFNVYRRSKDDLVTVTEGTVALRAGESKPVTVLSAGEQAVVRPDASVQQLHVTSLARATSWTQRKLVFDSTPVGEVVAELNRYNRVQLTVEDVQLAARAVTGTFESGDPQSFVDFLLKQAPVSLRRDADGTLRLFAGGSAAP